MTGATRSRSLARFAPPLARPHLRLHVGARTLAIAAAGAIVAAALALRLANLGRVATDPFYDAAIRSMGLSWKNFLFGALEPGGSVSIDKPAPALWPQVAATKLLGFHTTALLLPEALAGAAGVWLLYRLVRSLWGTAAGLASAAALAVLPLAVLTARSDTMDALATALTVLAALALVRAADRGGRWALAGAGAAIGVAFNVKLFQALVPVPALVVLFCALSRLPWGERLSRLALAGGVALAVGLSWLAVVSSAPATDQPWAYGSSNGSALSATFGYNGIDRLNGTAVRKPAIGDSAAALAHRRAALRRVPGPAGPTRLVGGQGQLASLLGSELVPAAILGALTALGLLALAAAPRLRRAWPGDRAPAPSRRVVAGALFVAVWLLSAGLLFSFMPDLQTRYLDVLAPAVAAALGGGLVALWRWVRLPAPIAVAALAALLVVPALHSLHVVATGQSDSGHIGTLPPARLDRLERFLQAHTRGQRYELASATAVDATELIARDARPVLMLQTRAGHPLTSITRLRVDVRHGRVSYVLLSLHCGRLSSRAPDGCGAAARYAKVHGQDVSAQAGADVVRLTPKDIALTHRDLTERRYARGHGSSALHPDRGRRVHAP